MSALSPGGVHMPGLSAFTMGLAAAGCWLGSRKDEYEAEAFGHQLLDLRVWRAHEPIAR